MGNMTAAPAAEAEAEAAAEEKIDFGKMTEVEANPGRVNDSDDNGETPLITAALRAEKLSLVV